MRYITAVIATFLMALFPVNAFAGCPTITGPTFCCGIYWYTYSFDTSCAGTSGSVSDTNMWCYNTPAKAFGTGSSSVTYSYTIGASDPDLSGWSADLRYVEWYDPNGSIYNTLTATASITRNGSTTSNTFLSLNGTQSRSCSLEWVDLGNVQAGDTVTITINTSIFNSNVTAQVGRVQLWTTGP
ncbi:MAG TPA: hypothetical protein VHK90_15115 [Thermoanaerobaculia bacterium]|nr:hypothetical protein [Thermoanaerobaculia bacterium]